MHLLPDSTSKKRVFISLHYMKIGGVERSLIGLLHAFDTTKYDVDLFASSQYYSTSYATTYNNEMAGIGQFGSDDNHSDAQGTGMVRINNPNSLDNGDYLMWGHDGASLTTGLFPYVEYIPNISNR